MKSKFVQDKRGITPIISVILLLMMTIAIAGLAYTWLQRMQLSIEGSAENTSTRLLGTMNVELSVEGYLFNCSPTELATSNVSIYFRNKGTETASNLQLYVSDMFQAGKNQSALAAGSISNFNYTNQNCTTWNNTAKIIKITADETITEKTFTFTCSAGSCN